MRAAVYSMGRRISGPAVTLAPALGDIPATAPAALHIVVPPPAGQRAATTEIEWLAQHRRGASIEDIARGAGCDTADVIRVIADLMACGVQA